MTKTRAWPVKVIYMLIAAALAISLMIIAAPTQRVSANPGLSEWTKVSTPSEEDWVLAPDSTIVDIAVAEDGGVAYAIVDKAEDYLLKSTDSAATWKDITDALEDVDDTASISVLERVATDGVDADFVAVALREAGELRVYISDDGGDTFEDAGEVEDVVSLDAVYELAVSPAVAGKREIAIGGQSGSTALIFRSKVTEDSAGAWDDARYTGWVTGSAVVDIHFTPSWAADKTILVATANNTAVFLQFGSWGTSEGWNKNSSLAIDAVTVITGKTIPWSSLKGATAGIATPKDYSGRNSVSRYVWVNVNYLDSGNPVGKIFRVKNTEVKAVIQQIEDTPWLTNVSYLGYISEGKAIAGVLGNGANDDAACCEGVQVFRNGNIANMDICCREWDAACKPPTGIWAMKAFYVSADKAYAVAIEGSSYDESAWSVSFDDGDTWNQISLVDTYIDYLSDVAVSPNCNKMMLVSINLGHGCFCDSVWLNADDLAEAPEYSDKWLRTWCGQLDEEYGLLRLAPEETNGDTVYLVDRGTDRVYWNELETLACWHTGAGATVDDIADLALKDKETIYALDEDGSLAMSDDYAVGWQTDVDSKVDNGWTIAVKGDDILVGGQDGDVSHSTDGGETFTELEEVPTIAGYVTVAFDSFFDTNDTIYAATIEECPSVQGGVYRWVIDESDEWKDLGANNNYGYTGLVLGRNPGNPMSSASTGGVLYASYVGETCDTDWSDADDWFNCWKGVDKCWYTGVARCLTPAGEISCEKCIEWDYLTVGLTDGKKEAFYMMPNALKICGCLEPTTNTELFAIDGIFDTDGPGYDMDEGKDGTVWTFEDCYAKKAPELTAPANNVTIPADCYCENLPFTLRWDAVCDACYYDVQIALDDKFTNVVDSNYVEGVQDELGATGVSYVVQDILTCEVTYYWRVRAHQAETCQVIHSWWSDAGFITVAPSAEQGAITLVAPVPGDTGVATKNVGFSWNLLADANRFDWVLSTNADLSSPFDSKASLTNKAYTCTKTLAYGTTYYWQVKAYKNGTLLTTSAVGVFTTAPTGAFCCPIDGLCFETEQLLKDHTAAEHPAQPATPLWVWIVIAIGAILVIVVIVLIFRTRRA